MKIYCPHCGVKGSADDSYSGRKIRCPKCQEMFDLMPDMAIDQSGFLTAAPGVENIGKAVEQDVSQEESGADLSPPAEEKRLDELLAEGEDSVDLNDFGAELDREIAESEQEGVTNDLLVDEAFLENESPIAEAIDQGDELADDQGVLLDADVHAVEGGAEGQIEVEISENLLAVEEDRHEVVTSFSVDDNDRADHDEEATKAMAFAEADLPEGEEASEVGDGSDDLEIIEDEPYGIDKEQCWQCGKKDSAGEPFIAVDGRLYCTDCLTAEESDEPESVSATGSAWAGQENLREESEPEEVKTREGKKTFTVGGVIREAWDKVKGIKGAIWAGSAIMYLTLLVVVAAGSFLLPDAAVETETGPGLTAYLLPVLLQVVIQVVSMLFIGGLLFMGIRRVAEDQVSWKMIFHGFSFSGKIIVVSILQYTLITIGFLLFILPGIYLTVGYGMAIPLIVDKNLSPWQALETSRKAVHKVWWKVAALYLVMMLLFAVALIPMGIGIIWVWPMFMVAAGVVYHRLFTK